MKDSSAEYIIELLLAKIESLHRQIERLKRQLEVASTDSTSTDEGDPNAC